MIKNKKDGTLLTINTGSSSIKFCLFGMDADLPVLAAGKVANIGGTAVFEPKNGAAQILAPDTTHETALDFILGWLSAYTGQLTAIAHRIVHGGTKYHSAIQLDADALVYLRMLCPLAPLHQPHNLRAIERFWKTHPTLPQYGCFDTAFHAGHTALFYRYALPENIRNQGVRRYGFHGLSYQWIVHCLKQDFPHLAMGRVIAAHLGNGSSLCAIKNGISIDSSMGMTALDGLPMGTRCGAIDPGVMLYMLNALKMTPDHIQHLLYQESGLKGLSGLSNDVKTLLASDSEAARFALEFYALKAAQEIASMAIAIGGMDTLVFTGGIGEHAEPIRLQILGHLSSMAEFQTLVIPANEERGMALEITETF